jgi:hypothetical protein
MKCRNCGTEIAEKALICFRCGEATTAPRIAPPPDRGRFNPLPIVITILILIGGGVWILPQLAVGMPRTAGWVALVVLTVLSVWVLGPRRRGRR